MTPERWRRVGELFHETLDLPADARVSWACQAAADDSEVRRELLSLLENDRAAADGVFASRVKAALVSMFDGTTLEEQRRVGPYKLLRELGCGGMDTVYLAERDDQQYQQCRRRHNTPASTAGQVMLRSPKQRIERQR